MNNYSNPPENDTPDWDELIGNTQAAKPKKQPKQDYTELATRISNEEGFDPNITLAVMKQESGQRNNAVSPKGASGLMQLMPATAKARGVRDLFDPEQNIRAGVQELKQHYKTNNGDLAKTLASYNWGSGNLQKKGLQNAPKETRDYIKNITSSLGKPINLSSTPEQDSTPDWDELVSGKASTVTTRPRRVTPVQRTSSVKPEQAQPTSKIDWSKIRIDDTKKLPAKTTIASKIASGEKVPSLEQQRAKTRDTNRESQGLTSRGQLMQALEYKQKQDLEARALNPALRSPEGMQDYNKAVQASRQGKRGSGIRPGDQSSNQLGEVDSSITNINDAINPYISNPNTPIIGDVPGQAVRGLTAGTLGSREEPSTLGGAIANVGGQFAPDIAAIGLTGGLGGVKSIASPILRSAVGTGLGLGLAQTGREAISGQLGSDQATKNILTKTAAGALGGGLSEVVPALGAGATIPQQIVNRGARTLYGTAGNLPFEGLNAIDSVSQGANPRDAFSQAIINSVLQAGAGEFVHGVADNARPNGIPMPGRPIGEQKLLNPSPLDPNYAPTQPLNYSDLASTKPLDYNDFANTIPLPAKQPRFNPILKGGLRPTEGLTPFERLTRPTPTEPIDLANKGTERLTSTQPDLQSIALPSIKLQSQPLTDTLPFRPLEEVSPYTTQPMTPAERQAGFKPIETTKEMVLPKIQSPIDQLDSYTTQPMTQAEQLQQEQNMTDRRRVNLRNFFDQEGQTGYMDEQGKPLFMTPFDRDASNGGLPPLSPEFLLNQSANPTRQIPFERRRLENARIAQKQDFFGQDKIRLPELNNTYRLNPGQQTQDINLNPVPLDAPEYSVLERAGLIRPKRQIQQGETGTNQNINPNSAELTAILGNENPTQIQPSIVNQTGDTPIQGIGEEKGFSFREADTYPEPIQGAIPPRRPGQFDPYPTQKIVQNPLVANRPQKQLNPPPDQSSTAKFNIPGFKPTQSTKPIFKPPVNKPMIKEGKAFDPFAYDKNAPSVNLSRPPVTPEQAKIAYDFFKQLENPNEPLAVGKTGEEVKTNAQQESMFGQLGEEKGQVLSDAVNKTVENRAKVKADKAAKKAAREKGLIDKLLSDQSGAIPIGSPLPSLKNLFQKLTSPTSPITPPANQPNLSGMPTNQAVKEQPLLKTASSTIKANMLLNPASALGDTIGTGGRLVVKNAISDTVRNAVDKQLAKIGQVHEDPNNPGQFIKTGENKRTFISGSAKETWNNFVSGTKGIKDAKNLVLKKGLTPTELQELLQHEIHTKGSSQAGVKGAGLRAVDNYVNLAGRVRAAFDEPAYKYALKDATQAELRVQAENSGIPRAQLDTAVQQVKDFQDGKINQITVHPRLRLAAEEILSTAKTNAMYETLRDDNAFSKRFSEFKNKLWEGGKGSQAMAFLLDQASPFARTGTNIIRQASDMSVGGLYNIQKLTREGYKQGGFTLKQQASLAKSLGDVAMGSIVAGIAAYAGGKGYAIKNTFFNPLSGENKQERTLNEAANREGGSFQIPFTNRRSTTHILGTGKPIFEFGVAAQKLLSDPETSYEDKAKGIADQILNSALEHPATTATRDLALAFFGPDKADSLYRQAVTRATTLVMPKFLEQLSRAGGEKRKIDLETEGNIAERFAKDVYNNVRDRLPGRSNYNQPEYTALGDQNKYPSFAVVDPFRSKEERVTPVTKELTKQNVGLNPLQRNKAQGETPQEFAERSRDVGKLTNRQLTDLVTSKTYAELPKLRQSEKIFRDDKTLTDRGLKEEAIKSIEKGSHAGELTYPELSYLPSITSRIDKQIAPLLKNVKKDKLKRFANLGANVGGK